MTVLSKCIMLPICCEFCRPPAWSNDSFAFLPPDHPLRSCDCPCCLGEPIEPPRELFICDPRFTAQAFSQGCLDPIVKPDNHSIKRDGLLYCCAVSFLFQEAVWKRKKEFALASAYGSHLWPFTRKRGTCFENLTLEKRREFLDWLQTMNYPKSIKPIDLESIHDNTEFKIVMLPENLKDLVLRHPGQVFSQLEKMTDLEFAKGGITGAEIKDVYLPPAPALSPAGEVMQALDGFYDVINEGPEVEILKEKGPAAGLIKEKMLALRSDCIDPAVSMRPKDYMNMIQEINAVSQLFPATITNEEFMRRFQADMFRSVDERLEVEPIMIAPAVSGSPVPEILSVAKQIKNRVNHFQKRRPTVPFEKFDLAADVPPEFADRPWAVATRVEAWAARPAKVDDGTGVIGRLGDQILSSEKGIYWQRQRNGLRVLITCTGLKSDFLGEPHFVQVTKSSMAFSKHFGIDPSNDQDILVQHARAQSKLIIRLYPFQFTSLKLPQRSRQLHSETKVNRLSTHLLLSYRNLIRV